MQTFQVEWVESIQKNGKEWKKATIADQDGKTYDVSVWPDFKEYDKVLPGSAVVGMIRENGKYKNLVDALEPPRFVKDRVSGIKAAQERKGEMIKEAQERKNESIAYFNAINCAIALLKDKELPIDIMRNELIAWRDWFLQEWQKYETGGYEDKHKPF